jgi:two-component system, chemotaxis family, CheB/CheR fusion protein
MSEPSALVVGIGASAGGLAAFKSFLRHTPSDTGMAFVLVQHLDPHHKSLMVELLGPQVPFQLWPPPTASPSNRSIRRLPTDVP